MKATLILCETATSHPDGTISMLRAGITHVWGVPSPVVGFQGVLLIRIEASPPDLGSHVFDLKCMDLDGAVIGPVLEGQFEVPKGGWYQTAMLTTNLGFPKFGKYQFVVRIDNVEKDSWSIFVADPSTRDK